MNERAAKLIGLETLSIVEAMSRIDDNCCGILFITDATGVLKGSLTDGDIRRWILKAGSLNAAVVSAMKTTPKTLFVDEEERAQNILRENKITAIPLLDSQMRVVDIVLRSDGEVGGEKKKRMLTGIPVVVMAGGKGTRLYPYTKILPKPLIPIGDTPIIERVLNEFAAYGIDHFYMTVNYKKGMIRSYFADLMPRYTIDYVEETKPLGTSGSIKLIEKKFDKPLFVTNCDALILTDYAELYDFHVRSGNTITMVSSLKNMMVPYGVLHAGENGELLSIEEKPKLSYFINTGMYVINPESIELIPDGVMFHMTHLIEEVMRQGGKVGMYPVSEDSFLDMGEFGEMKRMEEKLHIVSK